MQQIKIGIIMGSQSDWPTMQEAANILDDLGINFEKKIVSAHRTPDRSHLHRHPYIHYQTHDNPYSIQVNNTT